jgi:hypothetical protein
MRISRGPLLKALISKSHSQTYSAGRETLADTADPYLDGHTADTGTVPISKNLGPKLSAPKLDDRLKCNGNGMIHVTAPD